MHSSHMARWWKWAVALLGACGDPAAADGPHEPPSAAPPSASAVATVASSALAPPVVEEKPLVFVAGGDVNLGREQGQRILRDPKYDPFSYLGGWLSGADLTFVNLESQLSDQKGETQSPIMKLVFTGPPGGAEVIKAAGIDIVSLANNHAWDYGKKAFLETLDNLERAGVPYVGVSREPGKQYDKTVVEVGDWSVAFFAVTHIWNAGSFSKHVGRDHVGWASWGALKKKVALAKQEHDLVFVSYHGGVEYGDLPYPPTKDFIKAAMADGVDVVLGHHTHVPMGIGFHDRGRVALYGLGNLVFDKRSDKRWERTSFLARFTFRKNGTRKLELCPYDLRGYSPHPFSPERREAAEAELGAHLGKISEPFGGLRLGSRSADGCLEALPK
jgi:poly-gamma-glutamate capsule biosynthesis protein CapA/YwtB (metallophosphatase superfamily)